MSASNGHAIEVWRSRIGNDREVELLRFWLDRGALDEQTARQRLPQVVCVLRGIDGGIAGVNTVYPERIAMVGGRRFWVYRSLLPAAPPDATWRMVKAAFDALELEFEGEGGEPVGLCRLVGDRTEITHNPEAVWPESGLLYAGYLDDGRQVRIRYFEDGRI